MGVENWQSGSYLVGRFDSYLIPISVQTLGRPLDRSPIFSGRCLALKQKLDNPTLTKLPGPDLFWGKERIGRGGEGGEGVWRGGTQMGKR